MAQLNQIARLGDWMTQRGQAHILEQSARIELVHIILIIILNI